VDDFRDFGDLPFEEPERVGVREHEGRGRIVAFLPEYVEVRQAVLPRRDLLHRESRHRRGRGIVPWEESGTMTFLRLESPRER